MAEGGMLPWKANANIVLSPDIDSYGQPLPNPPPGYYWKNEGNNWELIINENEIVQPAKFNAAADEENQDKRIIEHIVLKEDTISGICLKYNITPVLLRRFNRFSGNNIQQFHVLKIPLDARVDPNNIPNQDIYQIRIQQFKHMTNEGDIESKLYLEDANNDLDLAIKNWKNDNIFTKKILNPNQEHSGTHSSKAEYTKLGEVPIPKTIAKNEDTADLGSEVEMKNINED